MPAYSRSRWHVAQWDSRWSPPHPRGCGGKPNDAATIAAVVGLVVVIALAAAIGPARRASGIDPLRALRYE